MPEADNNQQALRPGTVLDSGKRKYTIRQILGVGGFGITYLATCKITVGNVPVEVSMAIKEHFMKSCYRDENGQNVLCAPLSVKEFDQSREDFIKEAERLQELCRKSKNIVNVNESFTINGTAYYVMEYINEACPKKLNEKDAIKFIKEIASGLKIMHANNMLHLDIKPDNILVRDDGSGNKYPVLIDFGLAKHFNKQGVPTSHLLSRGATPGYSPIEQYSDKINFSPKYDVYSLGAVLLYLLTGKNPPDAFSISPNQKEINDLIPNDVNEGTRQAILGAMRGRPEERIATVDDFINALGQEPNKTIVLHRQKKESGFTNVANWFSRHRKPFIVTGAALVLCALIGFGIYSFTSKNDTIAQEPASDPESVTGFFINDNGIPAILVNDIPIEMIKVTGGTFVMGAHNKQLVNAFKHDTPKHDVELKSYYIGKTEVPQALWVSVMGSNPSSFKGDSLPVEHVSWKESMEFIERLNELTGKKFRLPTEAEWEYAARGGNKSNEYLYSGSDNSSQVGWLASNSNKSTHKIASLAPNELGIYDMTGNVWEWCSDWFDDYTDNTESNPTGPDRGTDRVRRGGSWDTFDKRSQSSSRGKAATNFHSNVIGLRLAIDDIN